MFEDVPSQPQTVMVSTPSVNEGKFSPTEVFININMSQFKLVLVVTCSSRLLLRILWEVVIIIKNFGNDCIARETSEFNLKK